MKMNHYLVWFKNAFTTIDKNHIKLNIICVGNNKNINKILHYIWNKKEFYAKRQKFV